MGNLRNYKRQQDFFGLNSQTRRALKVEHEASYQKIDYLSWPKAANAKYAWGQETEGQREQERECERMGSWGTPGTGVLLNGALAD